ncbi:MAG: YXWGXW repeat-containing protein [Sandaracinaceae bacterium]|nr:YXWGXW repeat-containing protein [Sandaracinaceae bacterium]
MRTHLLAATLLVALALPSAADAQVTVTIVPPTAPAPPRPRVVVQRPAPPAANYTWVDGYWDWDRRRNRWTWVEGYWIEERPGYVVVAPRWVQENGRWVYYDGGYARPDRRTVVIDRFPRGRRAPRAYVAPVAPGPPVRVVDRRDLRREHREVRREIRQERRDDRRDRRDMRRDMRDARRDDRRDARGGRVVIRR